MCIETLRLQAPTGEVVAEANSVGAGIRSLSVSGVQLAQSYAGDLPPGAAGSVLVPWPNRIDRGRWMLDGEIHQLEITEPGLDTAIHGLLLTARYEMCDRTESAVTFAADISGHAGYPFELATKVHYELVGNGIVATHRVTNLGDARAPVALGAHPYLRVGDLDARDLRVRISANTAVLLDDRHLPIGIEDVAGTRFDLRRGVSVREVVRHACFTDLELVGGRYELALVGPDGSETIAWGDQAFRWAQLFVTDEFAAPDGLVTAVALESMTAPPNSLASGTGVHWIEPGEEWTLRRGIEFRPALG